MRGTKHRHFIPGVQLFAPIGGTSAGAPQWAGITADVNQLAGRPLGFINGKVYKLGRTDGIASFFNDVIVGNNIAVIPNFINVPGFSAGAGWDAVTGWGTPSVGSLARAMANEPDNE